ncbi:hypothetical protein CCY01nite_25930 [Chitinophaga cymbidii]|uniref:GP-PDE domain-containing protein n=2 Tax=Chitinophaga cymbidii TaxID=1096750 RepID=A0A512RKV2_9BACT|nr:hypothetical protein CCY01nite_25930 [Chitinophaga cymbidii]
MLPAMFAAVAAFGQSHHLHLDNYTIPVAKKGALVGKLHDQKGPLSRPQILEDTSNLFTLNKKGELRLKKKQALRADAPAFQYTITVQTGDSKESFTLVRDDFHRNKVVAHRGAFKNNAGSENSLTSLKDAIRIGCEGSEFDVWLSSDGVPVLSHDPHIGGKVVEETTLAELQKIELKNGDRVPTFEEYIQEAMKQNGTHMVLELKPSKKGRAIELTQTCYNLIRKYQCQAWMLYISFDYDICKKLVELDPFAKVAYLNGEKSPAELKADKIWGLDYSMKAIDKDISILQTAKKAGITTNIWTVNDPAKMDEYLKAGVDYITTNEPEILLQKVK